MICQSCFGTKMQMGGGMIQEACKRCSAPEITQKAWSAQKIDKRSKAYKGAVERMSKANPVLSKESIEKELMKQFEALESDNKAEKKAKSW